MKRYVLITLALIFGMHVLAGVSFAAPFDMLFKIEKATGDCMVQTPGTPNFVKAKDGNVYPYGTKVRTGRKASLLIVFSEGNVCRVLSNAALTITQNAKDEKLRSIILDTGKVEISLEAEFHKTNGNALNVVTPTAVCSAIGCKFSAETSIEEDFFVTIFMCDDGKIEIHGEGFTVPLDTEDGLTVSVPKDRSFIRLKDVKGTYTSQIRDPEGNIKAVELKLGSVIKIWRQKSSTGNTWVVTVLVVSPDQRILEAFTYNEPIPAGESEGNGATTTTQPSQATTTTQPAEVTTTTQAAESGTGVTTTTTPGIEDILTTTTTTTTSTTTTTVPRAFRKPVTATTSTPTTTIPPPSAPTPTPVGKR